MAAEHALAVECATAGRDLEITLVSRFDREYTESKTIELLAVLDLFSLLDTGR